MHARTKLALSFMAAILLTAVALLWLIGPGAIRHANAIGGPFSLVADNGRPITEHSFTGKYLAIYFGYTSCKDVCPTTLTTLTAALGRLGQKARLVQPIFITVDPARDTPEVLRRYVANFSPALVGLTGSSEEIARVTREYGMVVLPQGRTGVYAVDHSSVILLFAPNGVLVAPIPADASEMVMAQALARSIKSNS